MTDQSDPADTLAIRAVIVRDRLAMLMQLTSDQQVNRKAVEHRYHTAAAHASTILALRELQVGRPRQSSLALVGPTLAPFIADLERYVDTAADILGLDLQVSTPTLTPLPGRKPSEEGSDG